MFLIWFCTIPHIADGQTVTALPVLMHVPRITVLTADNINKNLGLGFSGIARGPCNNWHYLGHVKHVDDDDDDDDQTVPDKNYQA